MFDDLFPMMEAKTQGLAERLLARNQRVATAESCTGGMLAVVFTQLSGSSEWFDRGWVTYSNEAKIEQLQVPSTVIEAHGAVSEEVADAMAHGAMMASEAEWGVSITGIAGPSGGSEEKPVGTVCFGVASRHGIRYARRCLFSGDRSAVRSQSTAMAIELLLEQIDKNSSDGVSP